MPTATATRSVADIAETFRAIIDWQRDERGLVERDLSLHITQVAVIGRLHVVLYGTPGNAKSMTVDALMMHLPDLRQFKTQAYKASPPEQFLGQLSIKGMAEDEFYRIVTNKMADCDVAIIDEIARAPRAVLPAFQGMMVEREFDSGNGVQPVPLQSLIGTANHLPDDEELGAFFDRFALKLTVRRPSSQQSFVQMLKGVLKRRAEGEPDIPAELLISRDELVAFQQASDRVDIPDDVLEKLGELWSNLLGAGVEPSPRRYGDVTRAMQVVALLDGRDMVVVDDMQIAMHSLWTQPEEEAVVYAEVVKFASEWVREKAEHMEAFQQVLDRLGQVQSMIAAGADSTEQVTIADDERSLTDHAIKVVNDGKRLREIIERHLKDAPRGRDADLEATLVQIDAGKEWVQDRILGGLVL